METIEIKEEVSGNGKETLAEVMNQLVIDAENVVEDIGEEVRQELADEIAIIKDQFEKKKNRIMEKAKKNADDKTIRITDKIREALAIKIQEASTNTISQAFEQANHELDDLVKSPSVQTTKAVGAVSADKINDGVTGISKEERENVVDTEYNSELAKKGNEDEITISTISIEDNTEHKHWLK